MTYDFEPDFHICRFCTYVREELKRAPEKKEEFVRSLLSGLRSLRAAYDSAYEMQVKLKSIRESISYVPCYSYETDHSLYEAADANEAAIRKNRKFLNQLEFDMMKIKNLIKEIEFTSIAEVEEITSNIHDEAEIIPVIATECTKAEIYGKGILTDAEIIKGVFDPWHYVQNYEKMRRYNCLHTPLKDVIKNMISDDVLKSISC